MKVLITGGAGYLGRGFLRREDFAIPWDVTVFSRDETLQDECSRRFPQARYILGDVRNLELLTAAMMGHDVVIHAAAMKYIPEAELNASECLSVNVGGAQNVIAAARRAGVETVVGISTDKAVQPVNVYGASKMAMERLFSDTVQFQGGPVFTCVRYGNVVGSTGSVVPLFRRQYAETGRVRVTNPEMTRFWMSVDEAIDLVVLAIDRARAGSILIPIARAMKIVDVAKAATKDDVEVEVIGERPGEKQHELLMHYEESVRAEICQEPFHYELHPPGTKGGDKAFTVASHSPNDWMPVETMRELIADAEEV